MGQRLPCCVIQQGAAAGAERNAGGLLEIVKEVAELLLALLLLLDREIVGPLVGRDLDRHQSATTQGKWDIREEPKTEIG